MTDAQARELVEQTLAKAEFVRVRSYLDSNTDDGPALFASKGTAVIDDPVAAAKFRAACFNSFVWAERGQTPFSFTARGCIDIVAGHGHGQRNGTGRQLVQRDQAQIMLSDPGSGGDLPLARFVAFKNAHIDDVLRSTTCTLVRK